MKRKVIIIGSGPAGHAAAIYTARAKLDPLMFEGEMAAGVAAGEVRRINEHREKVRRWKPFIHNAAFLESHIVPLYSVSSYFTSGTPHRRP